MDYTLFYLSGRKQTLKGKSFKEALANEGISENVLVRVCFYVKGNGDNFVFDSLHKLWTQKGEVVILQEQVTCDKCGITISFTEEQVIHSLPECVTAHVVCPGCGHVHALD